MQIQDRLTEAERARDLARADHAAKGDAHTLSAFKAADESLRGLRLEAEAQVLRDAAEQRKRDEKRRAELRREYAELLRKADPVAAHADMREAIGNVVRFAKELELVTVPRIRKRAAEQRSALERLREVARELGEHVAVSDVRTDDFRVAVCRALELERRGRESTFEPQMFFEPVASDAIAFADEILKGATK